MTALAPKLILPDEVYKYNTNQISVIHCDIWKALGHLVGWIQHGISVQILGSHLLRFSDTNRRGITNPLDNQSSKNIRYTVPRECGFNWSPSCWFSTIIYHMGLHYSPLLIRPIKHDTYIRHTVTNKKVKRVLIIDMSFQQEKHQSE